VMVNGPIQEEPPDHQGRLWRTAQYTTLSEMTLFETT
jgi:hypothetical protein